MNKEPFDEITYQIHITNFNAKRLIIIGQNSLKIDTVAIMGAIGDANLMTKHGLAGEICVF